MCNSPTSSTFYTKGGDLNITDVDSGVVVEHEAKHPVAPNARVCLSFFYTPSSCGDLTSALQFQNTLAELNVLPFELSAHVTAEDTINALQIYEFIPNSEGPPKKEIIAETLDFGSCYTGTTATKTFLIRNSTQETLEVYFSSSEGSVAFGLRDSYGELERAKQQEHARNRANKGSDEVSPHYSVLATPRPSHMYSPQHTPLMPSPLKNPDSGDGVESDTFLALPRSLETRLATSYLIDKTLGDTDSQTRELVEDPFGSKRHNRGYAEMDMQLEEVTTEY